MIQEDIIRMAREAGGLIWEVDWLFEADNLQRFYQAAYAAGAADERKRICKQIAALHDALSLTSKPMETK